MENYARIRTVGRGAYGIVQLVRRKKDNKLVIIKEIPVEEMTLEERQSALNEVKVLDMLSHPNIISYCDSFFEDKALMIVMEYAEGGTIFEFLQGRQGELLDEKDVMHYFVQMLLSLQAIHSHHILHRDLKTQNIMLDRTQKVVKIGDFGISKVLSSKSKANTVVGTPCYISPELCEGKPYDEKSDIWALGCVLYEMASLRKAFDAANLPALVLKIMRGTFAPIAETYSVEMRELILSTLHLDPAHRPSLFQILALPICQNALINLHTDIGRLPCLGPTNAESGDFPLTGSRSNDSVRASDASASGVGVRRRGENADIRLAVWGMGVERPVLLEGYPELAAHELHVNRTQLLVVSPKGEVHAWKSSRAKRLSHDMCCDPTWTPYHLPGLNGVTVQQVSCGTSFMAFRSDRGILMTCGSGAEGCLGHGDYDDVEMPRIVESLLGVEVAHIACGGTHINTVTNDGDVYVWGCGDNGRLGLGGSGETHCVPQRVSLPHDAKCKVTKCGEDSTFFVTRAGNLLACGSNRYNKLGLHNPRTHASQDSATGANMTAADEAHTVLPVLSESLKGQVVTVAMGLSHTIALTSSGQLYSFGSNQCGQLGRHTSPSTPPEQPSLIEDLSIHKIINVTSGDAFAMAVTAEHQAVALPRPTLLEAVAKGLPQKKVREMVSRYNTTFACFGRD